MQQSSTYKQIHIFCYLCGLEVKTLSAEAKCEVMALFKQLRLVFTDLSYSSNRV